MDVSPEEIFQFTLPPPSSTVLPNDPYRNPSPRRRRLKSARSTISNKKSKKDEQSNDDSVDELEKYTMKALRGESLASCNINLFPQIISTLEEQRISYFERSMHDEVQNVYRAIKFTKKAQKDASIHNLQAKMKQDLMNRKQEAINELNTLNDKTKNIELNMILKFRSQIVNLENKHKKEIEEFENEWSTIDKQRMYNKTSTELSELRKQEDLYLEQKLYQDSIAVKKRADKIEKIEIQNALQQMQFDYKVALPPIKKRQEQEMKTLLKSQEDEERVFDGAKRSEINLLLARLKKIDIELENLNDLSYVERLLIHSKSPDTQNNNVDFSKSTTNTLNLWNSKRIAMNEFNSIPVVTPLNITKQANSASRRSLIRSPRVNSNKTPQKTAKNFV